MSTITMLCNFVFCFLSFVYIWNEYKKLKITNKNHLFVSQFSNMVIKYFVHIFLKLFKLDCYSAFYNNKPMMGQTVDFRKGNNSLFLIYFYTCKCIQSRCLHLPYTAALMHHSTNQAEQR